jgi:hypothetical protein
LPGHDYKGTATVAELNGCTSPWNTLALLRKLAMTGFTRFDGLLSDDETDPSFGIEEVVTCLLQKLLGPDQAKSSWCS